MTFNIISARELLKPPVVEPEQAPTNIRTQSTIQVTRGHAPTLSQMMPVVVMNDTTWNVALRKARSSPYPLLVMRMSIIIKLHMTTKVMKNLVSSLRRNSLHLLRSLLLNSFQLFNLRMVTIMNNMEKFIPERNWKMMAMYSIEALLKCAKLSLWMEKPPVAVVVMA